jgi:ferredoxin--NADP+ reductase
VETVKMLLEDVPSTVPAAEPEQAAIDALVASRVPNYVSYSDWSVLDRIETSRGSQQGRPRVKFTAVDAMLDAIKDAKE